MNYFVEGLQGSGKSTLAGRLSELHPEYTAIREGDYSPVELAWCACLNEKQKTDRQRCASDGTLHLMGSVCFIVKVFYPAYPA